LATKSGKLLAKIGEFRGLDVAIGDRKLNPTPELEASWPVNASTSGTYPGQEKIEAQPNASWKTMCEAIVKIW
jgi:hypothetical protein